MTATEACSITQEVLQAGWGPPRAATSSAAVGHQHAHNLPPLLEGRQVLTCTGQLQSGHTCWLCCPEQVLLLLLRGSV